MITDQKISTIFGKLKEVWKVNRDKTLADILWEIKGLCDNPSRSLEDMDTIDLEVGTDRYLTQEKRDHPDRFVTAMRESELEKKEAVKLAEVKDSLRPKKIDFKTATDEEKKKYRQEVVAYARTMKKKKEVARQSKG